MTRLPQEVAGRARMLHPGRLRPLLGRGRPKLPLLAALGYRLSMPHSGLARRIVATDLEAFRLVAGARSPVLDRAMPALARAADHSVLWMLSGGAMAAWGGRFGKRAAVRGLGSIALTSAFVSGGLKHVFRRPRPQLADVPLARRVTGGYRTTSFPSGHSASAFAFAVGAGSELPALAPPLGLLAGAVAYTRLYTGVHYPVDVLVGGGIGAGIALLTRVPWPVVHRAARASAPAAAAHRLDPNDDGTGLALVVNQDAGPAFRGAPLDRIRERLPRARIVERQEGEDLAEIVEGLARDCAILGICGGDGSVNAAAEAALAHERPLLVIPSGTLNHLARDLRLRSPEDALRAFTRGEAVAVDVAAIDGRPFLNSASFGAYTHMVDHRKALEAKLGRWPGHLLGAAKAVLTASPIALTVDGRERELWMVFIGNCRHEPLGFAPSRRPRLDDGVLDVRLVAAEPPRTRLRLLASVLTGRLPQSAAYERWETRELRVESDRPTMRLGRDGQTFDGHGAFTVEKRQQQVLVYAPHA